MYKKMNILKIFRYVMACVFMTAVMWILAAVTDTQVLAKGDGGAGLVYMEQKLLAGLKEITVPVYIKDNPGIMGVKLMLDYDPKVLKLKEISPGKLLKGGNVADNIGTEESKSQGVVIWSNVEEMKQDGELVTAKFQILDEGAGKETETELELSYSQPDTFDETYEDVELECRNAVIPLKSPMALVSFPDYLIPAGAALLLLVGLAAGLMHRRRAGNTAKKKRPEPEGFAHEGKVSGQAAPVAGSITGMQGNLKGRTVMIEAQREILIGRAPKAANVLVEERYDDISRRHCSIGYDVRKSMYEVTDYSLNGTFIEGGFRLHTGIRTFVPGGISLILGEGSQKFRLN